jgi:integrase
VAEEKLQVDYRMRKKAQRLPTVLTKEQVAKIISACGNLKHRLILMTTYAAGLRASEVAALKPEHIDSERMLVRIVDGKGRKDRYTMLSTKLLEELRGYYRKYQPKPTCSPHRLKPELTSRSPTRPCDASMRRPERRPGSIPAQAFTPCATASRPICWKKATISAKSRS